MHHCQNADMRRASIEHNKPRDRSEHSQKSQRPRSLITSTLQFLFWWPACETGPRSGLAQCPNKTNWPEHWPLTGSLTPCYSWDTISSCLYSKHYTA